MRKLIIIIFICLIFGMCYLTFAYFFFEGTGPIRTCTTGYSYEEIESKINTIVIESNFEQENHEKFKENKLDVDEISKESYRFNSIIMEFNDTIKLRFFYSIYPFKNPIKIDYGYYLVCFPDRDNCYRRKEFCDDYGFCEKEALAMFESEFLNKVIK